MLQPDSLLDTDGASAKSHHGAAPTIVIPTFSRAHSLKRLLGSLSAARYPSEARLVVSIDGGGSDDVARVAEQCQWPHGEKLVIRREKNLGVRQHLIVCGEMTEQYGSVIILEDDLFVAPSYYEYAKAALEHYADDPKIAGVGLCSINLNFWNWQPFVPFPDPYDVLFVQAIAPWGQVWSRRTWLSFRSWLENENDDRIDVPWLPRKLRTWGPNLDRTMYKYVVETDRYFVHPKPGLLTNFCEAGAHFPKMNDFQVPLALGDREIKLCKFKESRAVYDAWFELEPRLLAKAHASLAQKTFSVDLFGTKDPANVSAPFMLTVKPAKTHLASFGLRMRPRELNVLYDIAGDDIVLARTEEVAGRESKLRLGYREHYYTCSHLKVSQMFTAIFAKAFTRAKRMIATRQFR